ncbi:MAG: nitroreductase family protein [Desulfomonilaceae bacterium]
MELCDCLESRKSVRSFLPKQVDKKVPKKIVEAANRSPSDMNTQPWKVFDTGWLSISFSAIAQCELSRLLVKPCLSLGPILECSSFFRERAVFHFLSQ